MVFHGHPSFTVLLAVFMLTTCAVRITPVANGFSLLCSKGTTTATRRNGLLLVQPQCFTSFSLRLTSTAANKESSFSESIEPISETAADVAVSEEITANKVQTPRLERPVATTSNLQRQPRQRQERSPPRQRERQRQTETAPFERKRAPHQFDHTKEQARPFVRDAKTEIQSSSAQSPNEEAPLFDLDEHTDQFRCMMTVPPETKTTTDVDESIGISNKGKNGEKMIEHQHLSFYSLDDLFPSLSFSETFAESNDFRVALRNAMREDIFDTTAAYAKMSEKARRMLLLPDSSLQGSWRCKGWIERQQQTQQQQEEQQQQQQVPDGRMKKLTTVLQQYLGAQAPTGDELMETIGSLCGSQASTLWVDAVGITHRKIPHAWKQENHHSVPSSSLSSSNKECDDDSKIVVWGFPSEDQYDGVGVFPHFLKLSKENRAPDFHPPGEPLMYAGSVEEQYIVRPRFAKGREILMYRDVDVIHSEPDIAYRETVMKFM